MLLEEQAAELLRRCELITGQRLLQIRGNLRKSESRAAAIWELLVLEEASRIVQVQYEPYPGGSPDILLHLPEGRQIWLELAFLYPRFWKQDRQSKSVARWITAEAKRRGISPFKVSCRFDGNRTNAAGPVRNLPGLHERNKFLKEPQVRNFFQTIDDKPEQSFSIKHSTYSVELIYNPKGEGPFLSTGGGLVQEAPKTIKEHAVFRVLIAKARQHQVQGPRLICIASDQSPALSRLVRPGPPKVEDAVFAAFNKTRSISGVIILRIQNRPKFLGGFEKEARVELFVNPNARYGLSENEVNRLRQLNFNRWKYYFQMPRYEVGNNDTFRKVGGSVDIKPGAVEVELKVPSNILIDSLVGKTNLIKEFAQNADDPMFACLSQGWVVKSCSLEEGNIERGEAPKVVLVLEPPLEAVFWPDRKNT